MLNIVYTMQKCGSSVVFFCVTCRNLGCALLLYKTHTLVKPTFHPVACMCTVYKFYWNVKKYMTCSCCIGYNRFSPVPKRHLYCRSYCKCSYMNVLIILSSNVLIILSSLFSFSFLFSSSQVFIFALISAMWIQWQTAHKQSFSQILSVCVSLSVWLSVFLFLSLCLCLLLFLSSAVYFPRVVMCVLVHVYSREIKAAFNL